MVKRNRNKKSPKRSKAVMPKNVFIQGPFGTQLGIPVGRLPIRLGSDMRLPSTHSVYPQVDLDVPINLQTFNIAAGSAATALQINWNVIANPSRFQNLFDEYCIVGARLELRLACQSAATTYGGFIAAAMDEKDSVAPTATILNAPHLDVAANPMESPNHYYIDWKARDLADLVWTQSATTFTPVNLKMFCTPAGTATNSGLAAQLIITGTLAFAFRGYFTN
jgi:hypothetical protein